MSHDQANEARAPGEQHLLSSLRKKLMRRGGGRGIPPAAPTGGTLVPPSPVPPTIVYRRDLPRLSQAGRLCHQGPGICIPLEKCIAGLEAVAPAGSPFYLVESGLEAEAAIAGRLASALPRALSALPLEDARPVAPEDACFLDVETTGLGTALVFLIGTLVWREGRLVCRQFLARSYAEEAGILAAFAEQARHAQLLVTFNGKTFDVPSLRARAAAARVVLPEPPLHLDLLPEARRRFACSLPDCRLQTLERLVCHRHRRGDIAGADIGRAYHDFVRTGDARELALVVQHNRRDLLTLAELLARLVLA